MTGLPGAGLPTMSQSFMHSLVERQKKHLEIILLNVDSHVHSLIDTVVREPSEVFIHQNFKISLFNFPLFLLFHLLLAIMQ